MITGALSGIGLEFAHLFASNGMNLVLIDFLKEKLDSNKLKLEKQYGVIVYNIGIDLTELNVAKDIYNELKCKKIHIDYLINNACFCDFGHFAVANWKQQIKMINMNVAALTYLTRLFLPDMINEKYGKILNFASIACFQVGPDMSVFFATKAYVLSFSEAIANELKGTGVVVTVLCSDVDESLFKNMLELDSGKLNNGNKLTPKGIAKFGYSMMMKGRSVVVHGFMNKILTH